MEDPKDKPLAFSDRTLGQYTKDLLGEGEDLTANDKTVIKVTFRSMGGKWEDIVQGKSESIQLLNKVIGAWAQTRPKPKK